MIFSNNSRRRTRGYQGSIWIGLGTRWQRIVRQLRQQGRPIWPRELLHALQREQGIAQQQFQRALQSRQQEELQRSQQMLQRENQEEQQRLMQATAAAAGYATAGYGTAARGATTNASITTTTRAASAQQSRVDTVPSLWPLGPVSYGNDTNQSITRQSASATLSIPPISSLSETMLSSSVPAANASAATPRPHDPPKKSV